MKRLILTLFVGLLCFTYQAKALDGHRPVEPRSEHQERGSKLDHGDQHGQVAAREYQDL